MLLGFYYNLQRNRMMRGIKIDQERNRHVAGFKVRQEVSFIELSTKSEICKEGVSGLGVRASRNVAGITKSRDGPI